LVDPAFVSCIDAVAPRYFQQALTISNPHALADTPQWKDWDFKPLISMPQFKELPRAPERGIEITWMEGTEKDKVSHSLLVLLAEDAGRFVEVLPCLTPEEVRKRDAFFASKSRATLR
jgi:hypothetical protein